MFGFQRPFICDNGKEFIGKKKDCENSVSQIPWHIEKFMVPMGLPQNKGWYSKVIIPSKKK